MRDLSFQDPFLISDQSNLASQNAKIHLHRDRGYDQAFDRLTHSTDNVTYDVGTGLVRPYGQQPLVPRGKIVHAHIFPSFARKVDLGNVTQGESESTFGLAWDRIKHPPFAVRSGRVLRTPKWIRNITVENWASPPASLKIRNLGTTTNLRLSLDVFLPGTYPQQHLITLVDTKDPFSRWRYACTPFSFRTLARSAGWWMDRYTRREARETKKAEKAEEAWGRKNKHDDVDDDSEDEAVGEAMFVEFGKMLKERINSGIADRERFPIRMETNRTERTATLTFFEIVRNERQMELLTLEFVPIKWDQLVATVQDDFLLLKLHHDNVSTALIQTLELITRHQPSILVSHVGGYAPAPINQPAEWVSAVKRYLEPVPAYDIDGKPKTGWDVRLPDDTRKKAFLLSTQKSPEMEVIRSKSVPLHIRNTPRPVPIAHTDIHHQDRKVKHYFQCGQPPPDQVTASWLAPHDTNDNPDNYHFTLFRKSATVHVITLCHPSYPFLHYTSEDLSEDRLEAMAQGMNMVEQPRYAQTSDPDQPIKKPAATKVERVLNVLYDDLIEQCSVDDECYEAHLDLRWDETKLYRNGTTQRGTFIITQRILPSKRWQPLLRIKFARTGRERIAREVRQKLRVLHNDIEAKLGRLHDILVAARDKSPRLMTIIAQHLETLPIGGEETSLSETHPVLRQSSPTPLDQSSSPPTRFPSPERRSKNQGHRDAQLYRVPAYIAAKGPANSNERARPGSIASKYHTHCKSAKEDTQMRYMADPSRRQPPFAFRGIIQGIAEKALNLGDSCGPSRS
ncbi:hypothetical protein DFS34DRAFT_644892 [Phlyctochytrium arcticum]|nr:hypothetical protein DFS34DRAFT_644892 [Phlyctochytrium arcticum]